MWWWLGIGLIIALVSGAVALGALLDRRWGRGSMSGMSENMEGEAVRTWYDRGSV